MPWDLTATAMLLAVVAAAAARVTHRRTRTWRRTAASLTLSATVLGGGALLILAEDHAGWLRVLPARVAVVASRWHLPLAGLAAGLAWSRLPRSRLRRALPTGVLLASAAYGTAAPLLRPWHEPPPAVRASWSEGVCLQTTPATCSAACAATVLARHGIEATEAAMTAACLTDATGTSALGLCRGLAVGAAGSGLRVVSVPVDLDALHHAGGPVILIDRNPLASIDRLWPRFEPDDQEERRRSRPRRGPVLLPLPSGQGWGEGSFRPVAGQEPSSGLRPPFPGGEGFCPVLPPLPAGEGRGEGSCGGPKSAMRLQSAASAFGSSFIRS